MTKYKSILRKVNDFFKTHTLIFIYTLVLLLLLYGTFKTSGTKYSGLLAIYVFTLIISYIIFVKAKLKNYLVRIYKRITIPLSYQTLNYISYFVFFSTIVFIIYHLSILGGSPQIKAFSFTNVDDIANLRRGITEFAPTGIKYLSSFIVKGFLPFLILYFFIKKKYVFYYIILFIAAFYVFSLMQKSYIATILIPVFIFSLLQKKYIYSLKHILIIIIVIFTMSFSANPEIKDDFIAGLHEEKTEDNQGKASSYNSFQKIYLGLKNRVLIIPGQLVAEWFYMIPDKKPFLYGNGYRLVAKIKGEEYINYPREFAIHLRPEHIERGLTPNLNTASFMYDYANFGKLGLFISGIALSLLFIFIESIFLNNFTYKFCLNFSFILFISSTALTTTLLSGGWGIIIFLFILFKPQLKTENIKI